MAEAAEPEGYETTPDDSGTRRRYPWADWEAEPFKVWTIHEGADFDVAPYHMSQVVRTRADRNKAKNKPAAEVSCQWSHDGRVTFCFYRTGQPRPLVGRNQMMIGTPAISSEAAERLGVETVTCENCGNTQQRVPHLAHLTTCLTNVPGKGMMADHYASAPVTALTTMEALRAG